MLYNMLTSVLKSRQSSPVPCFCISHATPVVPERFYTDIVALGDYGRDLPWHISKIDQFWHEARPLAYSSAGLFAIPKILQSTPDAKVIGICSYRKVIFPEPHGPIAAGNFQTEVRLEDVENLSLSDTLPPDPEHEFFVTTPLFFSDGMIGQYTKYHILQDLLDYTALGIELKILTPQQAKDFLLCPILIPGGCDVGFYPRQWLIETLGRLEVLGRAFILRYRERLLGHDRFQVRALNFLGERLGSFFVLTELMRRYQGELTFTIGNKLPSGSQTMMEPQSLGFIPPEIFGRMHVFVENYGSYRGGLAD